MHNRLGWNRRATTCCSYFNPCVGDERSNLQNCTTADFSNLPAQLKANNPQSAVRKIENLELQPILRSYHYKLYQLMANCRDSYQWAMLGEYNVGIYVNDITLITLIYFEILVSFCFRPFKMPIE